jgi:hypothetical protein
MQNLAQIWHFLVSRFISETAFIDGEDVYVRCPQIQEIEIYDADAILMMMNQNPHLLNNVFARSAQLDSDVAETFCELLYNQEIETDRFNAELTPEKIAMFDDMAKRLVEQIVGVFGADTKTPNGKLATDFASQISQVFVENPGLFSSLGK